MDKKISLLFPIGHFYSPISDPDDLKEREREIWPVGASSDMSEIAWNTSAQMELMTSGFTPYVKEIDFTSQQKQESPPRYFYSNDQYPCLDAEVLYCMLRRYQPARIVEIGSGFSTLITAEVNRRHRGCAMEVTCIEPYPRQFLIDGVEGVSALVKKKVQQVMPDFFDRLTENDILFIDSSHVSKAGSDVNYLIFEVLPRLRPGVLVHIHDIFLPDEYPKRWVIEEGRNWNEQYLVRAFLQFNDAFQIVWASYYMSTRHPEQTAACFPRASTLGGGGSLWLRRMI
jgi:predicted O-methyltransferase YrrM